MKEKEKIKKVKRPRVSDGDKAKQENILLTLAEKEFEKLVSDY